MKHHIHHPWAPVPPMGWNSWNVYGASVTEAEVMANAEYLAANLKQFGWEYAVVDIQWYEPQAHSSWYRKFAPLEMDQWSRLVPAANRFPSAAGGKGFKPLADKIHALGLKFGIHMMRGIPRQAAHAATPILGTGSTARDIAHPNSICPWNTDMYGLDCSHPDALKYYESVFALYAQWGVDYVKVDDLGASRLYGGHMDEMRLIHQAIIASGRPMVLSTSPGPAALDNGSVFVDNANLWRITDDFWDHWASLKDMFDRCERWFPFAGPGHWPDCDMLPLGRIGIRNGDGGKGDRYTRFSPDEQVTMMSLWAMAQSPLMLGCELRDVDPWTLSLITNPEVLAVNQKATGARPLSRQDGRLVWMSRMPDGQINLAFFNLGDGEQEVSCDLAELAEMAVSQCRAGADTSDKAGLTGAGSNKSFTVRDLWARQDLAPCSGILKASIPAHGARLFGIRI